jgi:hypothetical protein
MRSPASQVRRSPASSSRPRAEAPKKEAAPAMPGGGGMGRNGRNGLTRPTHPNPAGRASGCGVTLTGMQEGAGAVRGLFLCCHHVKFTSSTFRIDPPKAYGLSSENHGAVRGIQPRPPGGASRAFGNSSLAHVVADASRFRKAASPASDTSTHFGLGDASAP